MKISNSPGSYGFLAGAYFFLSVLIALALGCAHEKPGASRPDRASRENASVVIHNICMTTSGLSVGAGSGVMIGKGKVLTAWHVTVCPGFGWHMVVRGQQTYTARLEKTWVLRDVARLSFTPDFLEPDAPAIAEVRRGQAVCTSVWMPEKKSACGPVDDREPLNCPDNEWCTDVRIKFPIIAGNSGGPVYNSDGALVALITGGGMIRGTKIALGYGWGTTLWDIRDEIFTK